MSPPVHTLFTLIHHMLALRAIACSSTHHIHKVCLAASVRAAGSSRLDVDESTPDVQSRRLAPTFRNSGRACQASTGVMPDIPCHANG
ncbi:uncharacterized protein K489DRAFT_379638 [Dissoconium aciculare CBS 342.82]|uniref:Secreted protein n=1 Tax=Dissoconium aciculare CBS 342.82 TaxID=1314786 RepID=A0A6J3MA09_9PEZI|nr:uncharacterized protein K489DRAFT_379638 [Dissoconium aciculare CBS 342.82]KAF1823647.1 hypothetical protein K489DRAFT_379638 [Dissoconium aciculare CBS 342.82]